MFARILIGSSSFVLAAAMSLVAHGMTSGSREISSIFFIAKSENKNQVHYGIRIDSRCRPEGSTPPFAYWRELEEGPQVTSELLDREKPAYGIASQRVDGVFSTAGRVQLRLEPFPDRVIAVETFRDGAGGCQARAITELKGSRAQLDSVFVQIGAFWSIDHIVLRGRTLADEQRIKEVLHR